MKKHKVYLALVLLCTSLVIIPFGEQAQVSLDEHQDTSINPEPTIDIGPAGLLSRSNQIFTSPNDPDDVDTNGTQS